MSEPRRRWEDLTPEERAGVDALVEEWLGQNVEVKVDESGRKRFRLIPGGPGRERSDV